MWSRDDTHKHIHSAMANFMFILSIIDMHVGFVPYELSKDEDEVGGTAKSADSAWLLFSWLQK